MNLGQLRAYLLSEIDMALGHPLLVGAQARRVLTAAREVYATDDASVQKVLDRLTASHSDEPKGKP